MSLLGLDIGTTGCKAILFTDSGKIIRRAYREYEIQIPREGWAEQDGEKVFLLACECIREAASAAQNDPITGMAISCQGEAVVPVDEKGRALRPFILGMDTRTVSENQQLEDRFGAERLFNKTGMPLHTINTLPKMLWLKENEKDIWQQAAQFLLYEDFIVRRICGRAFISPCLASRTQMFELAQGRWWSEILEACGIDEKRLASVAQPGEYEMILPQVADDLNLPRHVRVFSGGHDQACAALGAGVIDPGEAMISTGTAEVVEVALDSPVLHDQLRRGGISVYRHVVPGRYVAMTLNHSGGLSLRWFRDQLGQWEKKIAEENGRDAYDLLLADAPAGPTDIFFLPHFSGSGTPFLDVSSRAAVIGLTFKSEKSHLAKALLEGLTFELKQNIDLLRSGGIPVRTAYAVGGGAKSPMWLQLKADICRLEICRPKVTEAACLGAAILAGVGAGIYEDYDSARRQLICVDQRFAAVESTAAAYETRYRLYQQLYPALKGIYEQWDRS